MKKEDFKDIQIVQDHIRKRQVLATSFRKAKCSFFSNNYKIGFGIKLAYNTEEPYNINLQKGRGKMYDQNHFNISSIALSKKYTKPLAISSEKLADIRELLSYIPATHHGYFNSIFCAQETLNRLSQEEEDEVDENFLNY
ncbi:hypothetical protein L9F63_001623 [Diploptera punctata]|uniref:Uncharacterized protein n=1 Tax=Diploptera punctata TaxID=6984 RepID=A0AAD8EIW1_DIPPU|nr:hypothetical protein L9F63_001623 [Diploptera punctata]